VTPDRNFTGKDLISIFPNPASDFVSLYGNLDDIKYARWITVDGKIISDFKISGDRIRVPVVSDYPSSLYLILADQDGRPLQITKILVTAR
jgi:hypothetical protein